MSKKVWELLWALRRADAATRNRIAFAMSPATEHFAYPVTESYLTELNKEQRVGARRAAAILAKHKSLKDVAENTDKPEKYRRVGGAFRNLMYVTARKTPEADDTNAIVRQVSMLPLMDVEAAAIVFDTLVGRCAGSGVPVDHKSLLKTLTYWGDGVSESSHRNRAHLLTDFYTDYNTNPATINPEGI